MNCLLRVLVAATLCWMLAVWPVIGRGQSVGAGEGARSSIPFKRDEASGSAPLGIALAFIAGLIVAGLGAVYFARRFALGPGLMASSARRMRLVETLRLGPKTLLFLVHVDERTILLAQTADAVTVVAHIDMPLPASRDDP